MLKEVCQVRFHQIWSQATSGEQVLFLQGSANNFLFLVLNADGTPVELAHVSFDRSQPASQLTELITFLVSDFRLTRLFARVDFCWTGPCTLLPEVFAGEEREVYTFVNDALEGRARTQSFNNISFAYRLDAELLSALERIYPNLVLRHSAVVLSELFQTQLQFNVADALLHLSDSFMELLIKQKGVLVFYNQFKYETDEDVLYYILFTMEQLQLDPLKSTLFVAGERPADSALLRDLRNYVGTLRAAEKVGEFQSLQPPHFYYLLTQQQLCES